MLAIIILLLLSFIEATLSGWNVILMIIICRSFLVSDNKNFYLAFGFGLLLAILKNYPLGYLSLVFLLIIFLLNLIKKIVPAHFLAVTLLTFISLLFLQTADYIIFKRSFNLTPVLFQSVLSLPFYFLVKAYIERSPTRKGLDLRLKTKN